MDYDVLADELNNDPQNLGYQTHIDNGDHNTVVDLLTSEDPGGEVFTRESIPMGEVYAQVDWLNDWLNLSGVKQRGFRQLTSTPTLDASSTNVTEAIKEIFGQDSNTWSNLQSIATRPASRVEAVLGRGVSVNNSDIAQALN